MKLYTFWLWKSFVELLFVFVIIRVCCSRYCSQIRAVAFGAGGQNVCSEFITQWIGYFFTSITTRNYADFDGLSRFSKFSSSLSSCGFILLAVVVGVIIKIGALWDPWPLTLPIMHRVSRNVQSTYCPWSLEIVFCGAGPMDVPLDEKDG